MEYRKKPVVIEAFKYDGDLKGADGKYYVPDWAVNAFEDGIMYYSTIQFDSVDGDELYIDTLEGPHHVSVGDYVIRGVKGELYPCKPDIFEQTYEACEERCRMAEMKALEFLRYSLCLYRLSSSHLAIIRKSKDSRIIESEITSVDTFCFLEVYVFRSQHFHSLFGFFFC